MPHARAVLALVAGAFFMLSAAAATAQTRPLAHTVGPAYVARYEAAWATFKSWCNRDRTSREYRRCHDFWVGLHAHSDPASMPTAAEREMFGQGRHGSNEFLPWHRILLRRVELILQEIDGGSPPLMLPVWDVQASPRIPAMFRNPNSPLYVEERAPSLNDGTAQISAAIRDQVADVMAQTNYGSFRSSLENSPHGSVHTAVGGGPDGFMSGLLRAARDPLFFSWHAGVDRLWSCWENSANGRPLPSALLGIEYRMIDETGRAETYRIGDNRTAAQMGYSYNCGQFAEADPVVERLWLAQMAEPRGRLRLENVFPDPEAPGLYNVVVVTPDGRRSIVGTMAFFGDDLHAAQGMAPRARSFDFDLRDALRSLGLRRGDPFEVVYEATDGLEPVAPEARADDAAIPAKRVRPRIGRTVIED